MITELLYHFTFVARNYRAFLVSVDMPQYSCGFSLSDQEAEYLDVVGHINKICVEPRSHSMKDNGKEFVLSEKSIREVRQKINEDAFGAGFETVLDNFLLFVLPDMDLRTHAYDIYIVKAGNNSAYGFYCVKISDDDEDGFVERFAAHFDAYGQFIDLIDFEILYRTGLPKPDCSDGQVLSQL